VPLLVRLAVESAWHWSWQPQCWRTCAWEGWLGRAAAACGCSRSCLSPGQSSLWWSRLLQAGRRARGGNSECRGYWGCEHGCWEATCTHAGEKMHTKGTTAVVAGCLQSGVHAPIFPQTWQWTCCHKKPQLNLDHLLHQSNKMAPTQGSAPVGAFLEQAGTQQWAADAPAGPAVTYKGHPLSCQTSLGGSCIQSRWWSIPGPPGSRPAPSNRHGMRKCPQVPACLEAVAFSGMITSYNHDKIVLIQLISGTCKPQTGPGQAHTSRRPGLLSQSGGARQRMRGTCGVSQWHSRPRLLLPR